MPELQYQWPKGEFFLATHCLRLQGVHASQRRIEVDGIPYSSLEQLVGTYPALLSHLDILAHSVNFLLVGEHFRVITDVEAFRQAYLRNCREAEQNHDPHSDLMRHPYGRFDITGIHPPRIEGGRFAFCALNEINDLLYKASCIFPFIDDQLKAKYELLPL